MDKKKITFMQIQFCFLMLFFLFICFIFIRSYSWISLDNKSNIKADLKVYSYKLNTSIDCEEFYGLIPGEDFEFILVIENLDNRDFLIDLFFEGEVLDYFKLNTITIFINNLLYLESLDLNIYLNVFCIDIIKNIPLCKNCTIEIKLNLEFIETNTIQVKENVSKKIYYTVKKYE